MKTFLCAPALHASHGLPLLAVAEQLIALGHRVIFYSDTGMHALARKAGCTPLTLGDTGRTAQKMSQARSTKAVASALLPHAANVSAELLKVLDRHPVDGLVVDALHLGAALAAEKSGLPWASVAITPAISHPSLEGSAHASLETRSLRMRLGLPSTTRNSLQQGYSPTRVILGWVPEFDLGPLPPRSVHVGPLVGAARGAEKVPAWVARLREDRPLIVGSVSTVLFDQLAGEVNHYISELVCALNEMDVEAVISLGSGSYSLRKAPARHVRLVEFAPHGALFPRARLAVSQAGWGTLVRAMRSAIPSLMVPFSADQPINAVATSERKLGIALDYNNISAEMLCDRMHRLLAPDAIERKNAQGVSRKFVAQRQLHAGELVEKIVI